MPISRNPARSLLTPHPFSKQPSLRTTRPTFHHAPDLVQQVVDHVVLHHAEALRLERLDRGLDGPERRGGVQRRGEKREADQCSGEGVQLRRVMPINVRRRVCSAGRAKSDAVQCSEELDLKEESCPLTPTCSGRTAG